MARALEQIHRMRDGAQSHLLRCDNGNYYIVKFQNNPQHRRALVNELLGQALLAKWDDTSANTLQLAQQKGTLAEDLDSELERLYSDHVALQRAAVRPGAPGSRAQVRSCCAQVFRQARLWERVERGIHASEFTFPGDPMRIDFGYRRNGTRGFVHTISVSRAPSVAQNFAYAAARLAAQAPWTSEFAAVTDVELSEGRATHRFVHDTLRDAGIEPVPVDHFAVWVASLKPVLQ
jgi:hypothetical protein